MTEALPRNQRAKALRERLGMGEVARSMAGMSAARVGALGIGFASSILVTRALGPAGRGDLAVSSSIVAIGVQIGSVGLPGANTYLVARHPSRRREMLLRSLRLAFVVALLAGFIGWLAAALGIDPLPEGLMVLTLAMVPIGVAYSCFQYLWLGLGRPGSFWRMDIGNRSGYLALVILTLTVWGSLQTGQVILFSLVSLLVVAVWSALSVARFRAAENLSDAAAPAPEPAAGYALRTYLSSAFAYVVLRSDILIANALLPVSEVGNYAAAVTLVEPVIVIPSAVGIVLFGKAAAERDFRARQQLLRQSMWWTALLSLLVGAMLAIAAPLIVAAVYGQQFEEAVGLLRVSAIGLVPFGLTTIAWNYLGALGIPRWTVVAWSVGAVVNVALNLATLQQLGIVAAAWTSVITYTMLGIWLGLGCRSVNRLKRREAEIHTVP